MTTAAFVHSVLGTRRLIAPLLQMREGVLSDPLVRNILRFAWHATSVLMLVSAAAVAWPGTPKPLIAVIGGAWLATGQIEEHTSELQSLMRRSYAGFCLNIKT